MYLRFVLLLLTLLSFIGNPSEVKKTPIKPVRNATNKPQNLPKSPSPVQDRPATAIDPLSHVRLSAESTSKELELHSSCYEEMLMLTDSIY